MPVDLRLTARPVARFGNSSSAPAQVLMSISAPQVRRKERVLCDRCIDGSDAELFHELHLSDPPLMTKEAVTVGLGVRLDMALQREI